MDARRPASRSKAKIFLGGRGELGRITGHLRAHRSLVLEESGQVTGLVAGGGTGVDDVGAWGRGQQRGWEAAGLVL